MIVRIVKMVFRPDRVNSFLTVFEANKERIATFDGCKHLELWKETGNDNVYFTYSHWDSEAALNKYRFSELFKSVWGQTKIHFLEKAQAWSVEQEYISNAKDKS